MLLVVQDVSFIDMALHEQHKSDLVGGDYYELTLNRRLEVFNTKLRITKLASPQITYSAQVT
jgi:hypothetical protein